MAGVIPEAFLDLFQKKAFAHLATLMPDGTPQVTPVWCEFENDHVVVNSAKGRRKDKNMRERPSVSLSIQDPDNPYRYLEVRGKVVEVTEEGASEQLDRLAKKYLGLDNYPYHQPGDVRVIYRIRPERITSMSN